MLEKQIESKVCRYARDKGYLVYKFTSPQRRSVPDRIFISPRGVVLFIEFKREGGKLTKGQEAELGRLINNDAYVYVVDDVEHGYHIIRNFE